MQVRRKQITKEITPACSVARSLMRGESNRGPIKGIVS